MNWTDTTSYSRGDTARVPAVWTARVGRFRIVVHRLHRLDGWYWTCEPFADQHALTATTADEARAEAEGNFRGEMCATMEALAD